nr:MAG TPA: hypothetical protein [Caudoviricetes sp.]DAM44703.1 MAG TPA: hypothetical protein [Caudoviricetes sp.]
MCKEKIHASRILCGLRVRGEKSPLFFCVEYA